MSTSVTLKIGSTITDTTPVPIAGTVYFSGHSDDTGLGSIYYDDLNGKRREIIPTELDCGTFDIMDDCCFLKGTKIKMADYSEKNIEDIQKGDMVLSYNIFTNEFYPSIVKHLIINMNTINLAEVRLNNGIELLMNAYHPILTNNGFHSLTNYNNYDTLIIGDLVKTINGYESIINIEQFTATIPIISYNLDTVDINENEDDDKNDTFIANGVVVHNTSCPV